MKFAIASITLSALSIAAAAMQGAEPTKVDGWTWNDPDLGKFTIQGVCSIEPSKVSCWNADGNLLPTLSTELQSRLASQNRKIEARFGQKNRYLVAGWDSTTRDHPGFNMSIPGGVAYQIGDLMLLSAPTNAKTSDLTVSYDFYGKPELKLEPKNGRTAKNGESELKIKKIVRSKGGLTARMAMLGDDAPIWRLYVEPKGFDLSKVRTTKALKNGDDFHFVDTKGNPIEEKNPPIKFGPSIATLNVSRTFPATEWWIDSNINPDKLGEIGFSVPKHRSIIFANIPLDPRP